MIRRLQLIWNACSDEAEKTVDPASEYETQIDVQATATSWSITIIVNGDDGQ